MINKYTLSAAFMILVVFGIYFVNFSIFLDYKVSDDSAIWAQLGDYTGGVLNPILSFITLVLLIKSLGLQNEANLNLRIEMKNSERTEKLRSFESLFFNMINSQKELFSSFRVSIPKDGLDVEKQGAEAVIEIENMLEKIETSGGDYQDKQSFLEKADSSDQIFGLSRAFYIMVKIVSEKLSESEGFSTEDRRSRLQTLVNFTDFAQLRLILISVQYMKYHSSEYLKNDKDFNSILRDLGVPANPY